VGALAGKTRTARDGAGARLNGQKKDKKHPKHENENIE